MIPEVIVLEFGEILSFDSVADAELYIEPYDLDDYEIFDRFGHRLGYTVHQGRVTFEVPSLGAPRDELVLTSAIHRYLDSLEVQYEPGQTLQELLGIMHQFSRTK